jgi:hypothetical protein
MAIVALTRIWSKTECNSMVWVESFGFPGKAAKEEIENRKDRPIVDRLALAFSTK